MNENTMTNEPQQVKPKSSRMFLRALICTGEGVRDGVTYTLEDGDGNDLKAFTRDNTHKLTVGGYTGPALHAIRWVAKRIDPSLRVLGTTANPITGNCRCPIDGSPLSFETGNVCEHYVARHWLDGYFAETVRDVWVLIDRDDHVVAAEANASLVNGRAVGLDLATEDGDRSNGQRQTFVAIANGVRVDCVSVPARMCTECGSLDITTIGCPRCDGEIPWSEVQTRHDLFRLGAGPLSPEVK